MKRSLEDEDDDDVETWARGRNEKRALVGQLRDCETRALLADNKVLLILGSEFQLHLMV